MATTSKLIIVFKDSLMDIPVGLKYKILANGHTIDTGALMRTTSSLGFLFRSNETAHTKVERINNKIAVTTIPKATHYIIKLQLLDESGNLEKEIGQGALKEATELTITAISPWTSIPLSGGGNMKSTFFDVEYNVRQKNNRVDTVKVRIKDIPRKIVLAALRHRGSTEWAVGKVKTTTHLTLDVSATFNARQSKCNMFVHDVLTQVGISVAWIEHGKSTYIPYYQNLYPPLSSDWADKSRLLNTWSVHDEPLPGDVGVYVFQYSDATGHSGIILTDGVTISAGADKIEVNDAGFRNKNGTATRDDHDFTVFRRYKHQVIK